jgi:hypothetical protein
MSNGELQVIDMDSTMDEDKPNGVKKSDNMDEDGKKGKEPADNTTPSNHLPASGQHNADSGAVQEEETGAGSGV